MLDISIHDFLLYVFIGVVVSFDVAGLTAAKPHTYLAGSRTALGWASRNAFWHAALLLAYGLFAVGLFDWIIKDGLDWLVEHLPNFNFSPIIIKIATELRTHFGVTFTLLTIFIVWAIYRKKVIENPMDAEREAAGDISHLDWQRRLIHWALTKARFSTVFIARQMEAVAVAIDMLALAFLLKALDQFQENPAKVFWIATIIYLSVFVTVFLASRIFHHRFSAILRTDGSIEERSTSLNRILLLIRIAEPILIFYFVCELLCFVIWGRMSSSSLFFISAAILTFALVRSVGLTAVIQTTQAMSDELVSRFDHARQ